jgi:hypothetical protein
MNMPTQNLVFGLCLLLTASAVECFARRPPTFWERILRLAGISQAPRMSRSGCPTEIVSGQIYLVNLASKEKKLLSADRSYRSPIFATGGNSILALNGDELIRIPLSGAPPSVLHKMPQAHKLIAVADSDDELLVLTRDQKIGIFSFLTNDFEPFDEKDERYRGMLERIRRSYHNYDSGIKVQVDQPDGSGSCQVMLIESPSRPINVSECRRMHCGQPSLSPDRRWVVFIGQPRD